MPDALEWLRGELEAVGFGPIDYVTLADAASLAPLADTPRSPARLLVAAKIGTTRLIDNMHVEPRS